jgi:hypothetical protein
MVSRAITYNLQRGTVLPVAASRANPRRNTFIMAVQFGQDSELAGSTRTGFLEGLTDPLKVSRDYLGDSCKSRGANSFGRASSA